MSKKLPIYFSNDAWSSLQQIMGPEGKPSPTINAILEQITLLDRHGFTQVSPRTHVSIPIASESIPAGFPSPAQDYIDKKHRPKRATLFQMLMLRFLNTIRTTSMVNAGLEYGDVVYRLP